MALQVIEFNHSFIRFVSQEVPLLACPAVFLQHALLDEPAVAPSQQYSPDERQIENDLTLRMRCKGITDTPH